MLPICNEAMNNKKVLIITYYWPPSGGPGVQRVLKFVKYLPALGWTPIILTVADGEYPAIDETLEAEIPEECIVYKTSFFEPTQIYRRFTGMKAEDKIPVAVVSEKSTTWKKKLAAYVRLNFFIPDAKIGWLRPAVKQGLQIIEEHQPEIIFSSSPPPTVHLIAKRLARHSKLKWVADLRDPWSKIHYYRNNRSRLASSFDGSLEHRTLKAADQLITVSPDFTQLILAPEAHFEIIPNGFDPSDFHFAEAVAKKNDQFVIAYLGGLNENRFYPEFFEGLRNFVQSNPDNKEKIKFIVAGNPAPPYLKKMEQILDGQLSIDLRGYLPHDKAIEIMQQSDVLLLFLEKIADYSGHIPGKLFEYLMSGNTILGIGNKDGNAERIILETSGGIFLDKTDNFENALSDLYEKWEKGTLHGADKTKIESYSRKTLTEKLVKIFNTL